MNGGIEMVQIEVKRLFLEDEIDELERLLEGASVFREHYPNFKRWLKNATAECKTGERLAFGIFSAEMKNGAPTKNPIGGCILKTTEGTTVEMKSLYVSEEERGRGGGKKLLEQIEEHCIKMGYRKIATDVPCAQEKTFRFLAKRGYTIDGRSDRYQVNDPCYLMSKELVPYYTGDPFDWNELSRWFLEHAYKVSIIDLGDGKLLLKWEVKPIIERDNTENIQPKGMALISEEFPQKKIIEEFIEQMNKEGTQIPIILARSIPAERKKELPPNTISIGEEEIAKLTKYTPHRFDKKDIAGMIVEIKPEYFDRVKEDSGEFVYFKGAPIGKYLEKGNKVYFYVGPTSKHVYGFIGGFGEIVEKHIDKPENIWSRYEKKNLIFPDQKEFDTFARYKENLLAMVINNFKKLETFVDFSELKKIVGREDLDTEDLGHFYVDNGIVKRFYDKIGENRRKKNGEKKKDKKDGGDTREKILKHLMNFKRDVEKNSRQAFWEKKDKLISKPEETGRSLLSTYFTGFGVKEVVVEARSGKGKSDLVLFEVNGYKQLFESKIWHSRGYVMKDGLNKLKEYMAAEDLNEAYYVVFVPKNPEKIIETETEKGYQKIPLGEKIVHLILVDISRG